MESQFNRSMLASALFITMIVSSATGKETVSDTATFGFELKGKPLGLEMKQTREYSTSQKDFNDKVSETKNRLDAGDNSARVNPIDGPTVRVKTHGKIELGPVKHGSTSHNVESAAERALREHEK